MIRRLTQRGAKEHGDATEPKSFDDFELRLGDMMRGERATLGKSLLDVQRELRIKASYIAAIENADPEAFDTPGFIAGYVRSYARYLNMDPEVAFETFCRESGFSVAHGMSAQASSRKDGTAAPAKPSGGGLGKEAFSGSATPFAPAPAGVLTHVDARAFGSLAVLVALIGALGYGCWSVLKEVQQVQFAPVDQTPIVLADVDPLSSALGNTAEQQVTAQAREALDRLYRPQALEVPVLAARDAPISTLDPRSFGNFAPQDLPSLQLAEAGISANPTNDLAALSAAAVPQVLEDLTSAPVLLAVRPAWVEVTAADGSVIFEGIMEPGQTFEIPLTEAAPKLKTGESSGIYFALAGAHYGPVGERGAVTRNVLLSADAISENFEVADLADTRNQALATVVAELEAPTQAD